MEIIAKAQFITDFYGSAPALGNQGVLEKYIKDRIDNELLSFVEKIKKKSKTAESIVSQILSIFHRDDNEYPVIGNWMLKRCLIKTGQSIFNAMKDKTHPKKDIISKAIIEVEPIPYINIYDKTGLKTVIKAPSGVRTYTVTVRGRSFFKAYEWIPQNTIFEFTTIFDDTLLEEEHMRMIIEKSGRFGIGAFRERYGKFKIISLDIVK